MNDLKRLFFLDNIENSSWYRKIEYELDLQFRNGSYKINQEKNTILFIFNHQDTIEDDVKLIYNIINNVSKEIKIVEREVKPTYRKVLILENLDCGNCAAKIERIAKRTLDHEFIVVDFASTRFIIETTSKELIDNLVSEVEKIALSVDANINVIQKSKLTKDDLKTLKIDETRKKNFFIGISIFIVGFIIKSIFKRYDIGSDILRLLIVYVTYTTGYFLIAADVLYSAYKNIKGGRIFDEKFLMSLATVTALIVGFYDEAVFVMIFYKVGELLQQYAVNYSRKSIASLIDIQPQVANVLVNGVLTELDPLEVVVGDIVLVNPGERIPLDGVVVEGEASLDVSALTGESVHKEVKLDDNVLSGAINVNGNLMIKVTKIYQDSMVAKILDLVENASSLKTKSENFISKFAKYYTPTVVIIAFVLAIILPFIMPEYDLSWTGGFQKSIMTALVFLVVSCPCALVISIPLGFFGGIGGASRNGILIKGSNYLEALNDVDTFVFDKTGTLTTGRFIVSEIGSNGKYTNDEILDLAAHAEINSNHLIAKSIVDSYGVEKINSKRVKAGKQTSNLGVECLVDGLEVLVGKDEFLRSRNVMVNSIDKPGTIVYLAVNNEYVGYLIIFDEVKKEVPIAIKKLKASGIKRFIMLTGDVEDVAKKVCNETGINEYYSEMSPIEKVEKFSEIKSRLNSESKIAYVGDGINDAPVLSRADIGIAMGDLGSDAAIEVADIVLMADDLTKLSDAVEIARKTRRIVIQNIVLALGVKLIVLLLALFEPLLSKTVFAFMLDYLIYEALFADVGVSLIAIVNSLRAMRLKK